MTVRVAAIYALLGLAALRVWAQPQESLDAWVAENMASSEERVICSRDVNGEYFFVARAGDTTLRLGSRLDMSEYRDTHSFVLGWRLLNERGSFVTASIASIRLKADYVRSGRKMYADHMQYQSIKVGSKVVRVELEVEKCPFSECDTAERAAAKKTYIIPVCEAPI